MDLQVILNTFASDVFRRQADQDYVAARACFRMRLRQQFLWSSQQAVEKYLKAILLFNGKSARYPAGSRKEFGHDLVKLRDEVDLIPTFKFELDLVHEQFIEYLTDQGPNRYLSTTAYNTGEVLRQLDTTVWHVRRYCQYMLTGKTDLPAAIAAAMQAQIKSTLEPQHKSKPHKFKAIRGDLEIIVARPATDAARRALVWANLYYGSKHRRAVKYLTFSSSEVPPNERNWPNVDWDLVQQYVKL